MPVPLRPTSPRTTEDSDGCPLADRIRDIQDHGMDLTQWEEEFMDNVRDQESWTPSQAEIIERIYRERV